MKVNLRKANALQEGLTAILNDNSDAPMISLDVMVHDNWKDRLVSMKNEYLDHIGTYQNRVLLRQQLRTMISAKNHEVGVDGLLAQIKATELQLAHLQSIVARLVVRDIDSVVEKKIERKLSEMNKTERSFSFDPTYEVSIWNNEDRDILKKWITELKRFKQKLQDDLLERNVSAEVELREDMVKDLTDLGLL